MKFTSTIAALALSLTFSGIALADDYGPALDALTGDFSAIIGIDADTLINRPISKILIAGILKSEYAELDKAIKEGGYDLKKDVDTVVVAMAKEQSFDDGVVVLVLNKSTSSLVETLKTDAAGEIQSHLGINYWLDKTDNIAVYAWNDKNVMLGDPKYIKGFIERNADSKAKAKTLKDNKGLIKLVKAADKSKDVWFAIVADKSINKALKDITLSSADGKSFSGKNIENLIGHLDVSSGIVLVANMGFKTEVQASDSAFVINENISSIVGDPSLGEMGMGFLATCYAIKADKRNINSKLTLTHEQVSVILTMVGMSGQF